MYVARDPCSPTAVPRKVSYLAWPKLKKSRALSGANMFKRDRFGASQKPTCIRTLPPLPQEVLLCLVRMLIRRLCLQQRPRISLSCILRQSPVFHNVKTSPHTLSTWYQRAMSSSAAPEMNAEVLRQREITAAARGPTHPKQFHQIEDSLAHPELKTDTRWGFVIVRAVYGPASDAGWTKILDILRESVWYTLTVEGQDELLSRHEITTIEDEATLAGADSYAVRSAFRAWVADDLPQRLNDDALEHYGGLTQVRNTLRSNAGHNDKANPVGVMPPRWKYCVFVDEDSLRSLQPELDDEEQDPALKILTTDWTAEEEGAPTEEFTRDWDGGETDDGFEYVGWMYIDMSDYAGVYTTLIDAFGWEELYERPYKSYVDDTR
jgi:hypothetical protein